MTEESLKGHCPDCNAEKFATPVASYEQAWEDPDNPVYSTDYYRIMKCKGCGAVYFQHAYYFSENAQPRYNPVTKAAEWPIIPEIKTWPAPSKRNKPEWLDDIAAIDESLYYLFEELYGALNNDLHVLSAIGIRTTFDKLSELLGVDPGLGFYNKLKELTAKQLIGSGEMGTLNILTDAGNAAAHRGWKPTLKQLSLLMDILEAFTNRTLLLQKEAKKMKNHIPEKPKRK